MGEAAHSMSADRGESKQRQDSPTPPTISPLSSAPSELCDDDIDIKMQSEKGQLGVSNETASDPLEQGAIEGREDPEGGNTTVKQAETHAPGTNRLATPPAAGTPIAQHPQGNQVDARKTSKNSTNLAQASSSENNIDLMMNEVNRSGEVTLQSPSLAEEIINAIAATGRKQPKKDVAIVVDTDDLSQTLLIASDRLKHASGIMSTDVQVTSNKSTNGFAHIFVLETAGLVPILRPVSSTATVSHFGGLRSLVHVSEGMNIKMEEGDEGTSDENNAGTWKAACRTLLEIINSSGLNASRRPAFESSADTQRAHIMAVIALADRYQALPALRRAFDTNLLIWMGNRSIWNAIAREPVAWLEIGTKMESANVFDEAFIHCAGKLDSFPNSLPDLPPNMRSVLEQKAGYLKSRRARADWKLEGVMLTKEVRLEAGYVAWANVSVEVEPIQYIVSCQFRDWIMEHARYLTEDFDTASTDMDEAAGGSENEDQVANILTTATCVHREGSECLTIGGFYRLINQADDSYLPLTKVMEKLVYWDKSFSGNRTTVRTALQALKDKAKIIVEGLASSGLQYNGRHTLEYLTCIKVEEGDRPWKGEDEEMEDDW